MRPRQPANPAPSGSFRPSSPRSALVAAALAAPTGARCTAGPSQIPIALAKPGCSTSRAFLPWRLLSAVEAINDPDKVEAMFTRAGLAMEIAVDMRGWPQRVSGL